MASSTDLRNIFSEARPLIEQQLGLAVQIAALRDVATTKGLDWSQIKALVKAQVQDELDEKGGGKRVKAIVAKAEHASAYADMLGLGQMNEIIFSDERFDAETGELVEQGSGSSSEVRTGVIAPLDAGKTEAAANASAENVSDEISASNPGTQSVTARNEPEAAAEVAGDYLREPVAAEQGQIVREGDAPRETDRLGGDASRPDTECESLGSGDGGRRPPNGAVLLSTPQGAGMERGIDQCVTAGETASNPEIDAPPCVDDPDDGTPPLSPSSGIYSEPSALTSSPVAGQPDEVIPPPPVASSGVPSQAKASEDNGRTSAAEGAPMTGEVSRLASGRTDAATSDDGRDSRERPAPKSRQGCKKPDACRVAKFNPSILCAGCASERQKARAA